MISDRNYMASESLKIKMIGGHGRSSLKLEGTVLILNQKSWVSESKLMIPIESISVSEHPRFYKDLLIVALIIILFPLIMLTFMYFSGQMSLKDLKGDYIIVAGVIALLEFFVLFALVFNFLFTKKTVCLEGIGFKIEFWKKRIHAKCIDYFLEQLKQKQLQIDSDGENINNRIFGIRNVNPKSVLLGRCILFCLPALILQNFNLLILAFVPIALYLKSFLQIMRQPKEFRQSLKCFRRKKWDEAIKLLLHLHEQYPDYAPAMFLLLDTYIHAERFDDALTFSNEIPENYIPDSNALNLNLWQWKRMNMRRNEGE